MGRGPKPTKGKAKPAVSRKSPKNEDSKVRDLGKRLAETLDQLQTRDRELSESQEQQIATAEILRIISSSPTDVQPVLEAVAENAARLCESFDSSIFRRDGDRLLLVAHHGPIPFGRVGEFAIPLTNGSLVGRSIIERRAVQVTDLQTETEEFPLGAATARQFGYRTSLAIPLLRESAEIGAISIRRTEVRPFTERQGALLQTFADQAVIAIENVRLFNETKEALDRQTATSEILRVISQSPTDAQPVFDTIAQSAVRLSDAVFGAVFRLEGERIHLVAQAGIPPKGATLIREMFPISVSLAADSTAARAIMERGVVHVLDTEAPQAPQMARQVGRAVGFRSQLTVPMLRGSEPIGAVSVSQREPGPFSEAQIELLKTFADQAVIAIENVRLFTELQEKNRAVTEAHAQVSEALEQQTATSDILGVISSSPTDVRPVFETIASNARRLCNADSGAVYTYDGRLISLQALDNTSQEGAAALRRAYPREATLGTAGGQAILTGRPVHLPDVLGDPTYEITGLVGAGIRSMLAVPMLRGTTAVGAIVVHTWEAARPFTEAQTDLLQTFADQAVIAIENVRLFKELEASNQEIAEKSHQLELASQHKSEFLANMSHELRTPLNAIIGFSEVLSERMFGELNEKQEEYLKDIYASGNHLLSLINDILDLSKIEAGRMELELSDFHLPTALDSALTLVRERAGRRSIALHLSVDQRLGQIQGDERKVRQVVLNLLSNAIKFTPEGGRIEVRATPQDDLVEVSVSDTGVGIAREDQEAVFEEFRQVGTADKKVEGTGLGLTLCRKFVELHGGKIWVKSEVGAGSTFTFTIPVRRGE